MPRKNDKEIIDIAMEASSITGAFEDEMERTNVAPLFFCANACAETILVQIGDGGSSGRISC